MRPLKALEDCTLLSLANIFQIAQDEGVGPAYIAVSPPWPLKCLTLPWQLYSDLVPDHLGKLHHQEHPLCIRSDEVFLFRPTN